MISLFRFLFQIIFCRSLIFKTRWTYPKDQDQTYTFVSVKMTFFFLMVQISWGAYQATLRIADLRKLIGTLKTKINDPCRDSLVAKLMLNSGFCLHRSLCKNDHVLLNLIELNTKKQTKRLFGLVFAVQHDIQQTQLTN